MSHPNEPALDELIKIKDGLYHQEVFTNDIEKKINAIEGQINRRQDEDSNTN